MFGTSASGCGGGDFQAITKEMEPEPNNIYRCKVCNIIVTGIIPAESHLQGTKHKKAKEMNCLDTAFFCSSITSSSSSSIKCTHSHTTTTATTTTTTATTDAPTNNDNILEVSLASGHVVGKSVCGQTQHFTCVLCNKTCTGEVPVRQHLSSEQHAKKLRGELLTSMTASHGREGTPSPTHHAPAPAPPPAPFSIPIEPLQDLPDIQDIKDAIVSGVVQYRKVGSQTFFVCVRCDRSCTGVVSMKQHLAGEAHAKKIRLLSQPRAPTPTTTTTPEPPIVTHTTTRAATPPPPPQPQPRSSPPPPPFAKPTLNYDGEWLRSCKGKSVCGGEVALSSSLGLSGLLACEVCNITCTGRETMMEHLAGRQHLKMSRLKSCDMSNNSNNNNNNNNNNALIPTPPQFEDSDPLRETVTSNSRSSSSSRSSSCSRGSSIGKESGRGEAACGIQQSVQLKDIRIYTPHDKLTDLFE